MVLYGLNSIFPVICCIMTLEEFHDNISAFWGGKNNFPTASNFFLYLLLFIYVFGVDVVKQED